jgi:hypothetical protein
VIGSLDEVCNVVYRLTPIKGILVSEPVLDNAREYDANMEGPGDARKEGRVHNRSVVRIRGVGDGEDGWPCGRCEANT